jgi:hypothetical protein
MVFMVKNELFQYILSLLISYQICTNLLIITHILSLKLNFYIITQIEGY